MKRRSPTTAWNPISAGSLRAAAGRLQQRTGTHCELSGLWQSSGGTRMRILEGQLLPSDAGDACRWTYIGTYGAYSGAREPSNA